MTKLKYNETDVIKTLQIMKPVAGFAWCLSVVNRLYPTYQSIDVENEAKNITTMKSILSFLWHNLMNDTLIREQINLLSEQVILAQEKICEKIELDSEISADSKSFYGDFFATSMRYCVHYYQTNNVSSGECCIRYATDFLWEYWQNKGFFVPESDDCFDKFYGLGLVQQELEREKRDRDEFLARNTFDRAYIEFLEKRADLEAKDIERLLS